MEQKEADNPEESGIDFVSMVLIVESIILWKGMFIIDEIYRDDGTELGKDLPGGAGIYYSPSSTIDNEAHMLW